VRRAWPALEVSARAEPTRRYDLAINATALGMQPGDALPLSLESVDPAGVVAECVIAPEHTALLEAARERGLKIHTGVPMLHAQLALMLAFMGAD
jgi:shikimate 5-dehydrogenase